MRPEQKIGWDAIPSWALPKPEVIAVVPKVEPAVEVPKRKGWPKGKPRTKKVATE